MERKRERERCVGLEWQGGDQGGSLTQGALGQQERRKIHYFLVEFVVYIFPIFIANQDLSTKGGILIDMKFPFLKKLNFLLFFFLSTPIPNSSLIRTPPRGRRLTVLGQLSPPTPCTTRGHAALVQQLSILGPPLGLSWPDNQDRGMTHDSYWLLQQFQKGLFVVLMMLFLLKFRHQYCLVGHITRTNVLG